MRLVIHGISSYNYPKLRAWIPDDPGDVAEHVMVGIGTKGQKGADDFTFLLATPRGLARLPSKGGIIGSRAMLVMEEYSYESLWAWLEETVKKCERNTWHECAQELRIYFMWEYEGTETR